MPLQPVKKSETLKITENPDIAIPFANTLLATALEKAQMLNQQKLIEKQGGVDDVTEITVTATESNTAVRSSAASEIKSASTIRTIDKNIDYVVYYGWQKFLPDAVLRKLRINSVDSNFSMETHASAKHIYDTLCAKLKVRNLRDYVVIDATANAGGWSMYALITGVAKLISIEYNADTASALRHNISVVAPNAKNVDIHVGSSVDIIPKVAAASAKTIIVVDPPWGGKNYKDSAKMGLMLGGTAIETIMRNTWNDYSALIMLKAPKNFDEDAMYKVLPRERVERSAYTRFNRKTQKNEIVYLTYLYETVTSTST
jgi:tRNA/tmRNA/rRNA uracil-C5-methylase (TrmA/RlmC/RlmD family)